MVNSLPEPFKKSFNLGVQNYLEGKWGDARLQYLSFNLVFLKL